jgi:hypothetical protein
MQRIPTALGFAILAVVVLGSCGSQRIDPDAARCASIWNAEVPANTTLRSDRAIVYRWTDKAGDDGCGVVFVSRPGGE